MTTAAAAGDGGSAAGAGAKSAARLTHVADEVLVRFKPGVSSQTIASAHASLGAADAGGFKTVDGLRIARLPRGSDVKQAIKLYGRHPDVLYAEPNWIVHALGVPNDPSFGELWGLRNTGQAGGTPGADIDAVAAWDITTGSSSVVVVVIDTGIDYDHQDLAANMFRNTADCDNDGADDDENGFIDDCYGIDTYNSDTDPFDDHYHGTHVAGTIGAVGNNAVGVTGVNWTVQLMACKFLGSTGSGSTTGAIRCLDYVAMMKDRGVNIVATNNSWGGGGFSQALADAIDAQQQRGILFVAAAGNLATDTDTTPNYPASYDLPNILAIASTMRTDALSSFSNFGKHRVHVGAPGSAILSTAPGNTYRTLNGTSMATPHVTGVAALLKAQDPTRDWKAIKNLILAGGDDTAALTTRTITGKRLNALGALSCSDSTVLARLRPIPDVVSGSVSEPITLSALHIDCAQPNGTVSVTVQPGSQTVTLVDDGEGPDQVAGDGIYSAPWTPPAAGVFTLDFPDGTAVTVTVLRGYADALSRPFSWRSIAGENLNLGDDSALDITSPFAIAFGGGSFTRLWVGSNGVVSFSGPVTSSLNGVLPTSSAATLVAAFWDDLFPVPGTAQNVFGAVVGSAPNRELVLEWRNVRHFSCQTDPAATVTFQIVFFENSADVLFNYADTVFGGGCAFADRGGSATVGMQVGSTTAAPFSVNGQNLNNSMALSWTVPPQVALTLNGASFGAGQAMVLSAAVNPAPTSIAVDVYVALRLPDGTLLFLRGDGQFTGEATPLVAGWRPATFAGEVFRYTFAGSEPSGSYAWLGGFADAGTLNLLGPIATVPFGFSP